MSWISTGGGGWGDNAYRFCSMLFVGGIRRPNFSSVVRIDARL